MRGTQSKNLMRMTREERADELKKDLPDVDYFQKKSGSVVVHPYSLRALYLQMKRQFAKLKRFAGEVKLQIDRARRPFKSTTPQKSGPVARIQKPLDLILQHNLPEKGGVDAMTGEVTWIPSPVYVKAARAAKRGDGATVKRMAAAYA